MPPAEVREEAGLLAERRLFFVRSSSGNASSDMFPTENAICLAFLLFVLLFTALRLSSRAGLRASFSLIRISSSKRFLQNDLNVVRHLIRSANRALNDS